MSAVALGRPVVHGAVDLLLIAGGLSYLVFGLLAAGVVPSIPGGETGWLLVVMGANLAHFASSTVRLYTKRGAGAEWPFVVLALPLFTLLVLALSLTFAQHLGWHLQNLYLTWSAYHYAAQTYGIAMIYAYRSGAAVDDAVRRLLRAACMLPFAFLFVRGPQAGIEWLAPAWLLHAPAVAAARSALIPVLAVASLLAPVLLFAAFLRQGRALPLFSLLAMGANALWWTTRETLSAAAWVPLFHGLQYLPLVTAYHVKEKLREPGNAHGALYHAAWFYGACLVLAYFLFEAWPHAFVAVGFGMAESVLLVVATINIHHFIVDAYIWRVRRDPNLRLVTEAPPTTPQPAAA